MLMSLLDKLIERKDLKAYIKFRREFLQQERKSMVLSEDKPEEKRKVDNMIEGRIKELNKLEEAVEEKEVKIMSKRYWRKMHYKEEEE